MLLLTFIAALLVLFNVFLVVLQIDSTQTVAITRYNTVETEVFTRANVRSLYVFALAPIVFFAAQLILAVRVYEKQRNLSTLLLIFGLIVLLFSVIVSSAIISVNK